MAEMRSQFLEDNWDHAIHAKLLTMHMKPGITFLNFACRFELKNATLTGSPLQYGNDTLCSELTALLTPRLQAYTYSASILSITDYVKWKKEMLQEDKLWSSKRSAEAEGITALHAKLATTHLYNRSTPRSVITLSNSHTGTASTYSKMSDAPIPPLTNEERQLLRDNHRCFKCHKFYAGHMKRNCQDWLSKPYKTLMPADAIAAQKRAEASKKPTVKVAAVNVSSSSHIEDADNDSDGSDDDLAYTPVGIAAMHMSALVAFLVGGLSMDSDDEWDSEYVPNAAPHLVWNTYITAPSSPSDMTIPMLMDTGAAVNLIDKATVNARNLRRHSLPQPMPFTDAFAGKERSALEWIKSVVTSPDGSYSSRSLRAIIVPSLCHPVILGVPSLTRNELLVDLNRHALWDPLHVNILCPSTKPPQLPEPSPSEHRADKHELDRLNARLCLIQHHDLI